MDWTPIIVAVIGIFGSAGLWQWFQFKAKLAMEAKATDTRDKIAFRKNLELQVETMSDENKDLREKVEHLLLEMADVKAQLASAHATIRFLEDKLMSRG